MVSAAVEGRLPSIGKKIVDLREQVKARKDEKKVLQRELKNAREKRKRLMSKTRGLSTNDLMDLMAERAAMNAEADANGVSPSPAVRRGAGGASGSVSGNGSAS